MPVTFTIDTKKKTVFMKRIGPSLPHDIINEMQEITRHPDFQSAEKFLSDLTEADLAMISTEALTEYAQFCTHELKNMSVAIVAPVDLSYGISRMFEMLADIPKIKVFKERDEALEWLEIDDLTV